MIVPNRISDADETPSGLRKSNLSTSTKKRKVSRQFLQHDSIPPVCFFCIPIQSLLFLCLQLLLPLRLIAILLFCFADAKSSGDGTMQRSQYMVAAFVTTTSSSSFGKGFFRHSSAFSTTSRISTAQSILGVMNDSLQKQSKALYAIPQHPPARPWRILSHQRCRASSTSLFGTTTNNHADNNQVVRNSSTIATNEFLRQVKQSLCQDILPQIIIANPPTSTCGKSENEMRTSRTVLLVAVSGGCDSMGLLHALLDTSTIITPTTTATLPATHDNEEGNNRSLMLRQFAITTAAAAAAANTNTTNSTHACELHVAHFDHGQRGLESQLDAELVQNVCQQHQLPYHLYQWDVRTGGAFSQDKARRWRQTTLNKLLQNLTEETSTKDNDTTCISMALHNQTRNRTRKQLPGAILTAHHAGDSQETILLKLLRGAYVPNLVGMTKIQCLDHVSWARPLLDVTKEQIQCYMESQGYHWREDKSNQSPKYLRNRIRNELIPLMQDLVGGETVLQKRLENLEEQCREIDTYLNSHLQRVLEHHVDDNGWFHLPSSAAAAITDNATLDLAFQQALYQWASRYATDTQQQISYTIWKKVMSQLLECSDNRQWELPLGDGKHIRRVGNVLQINAAHGKENAGKSACSSAVTTKVSWEIIDDPREIQKLKSMLLLVRLPTNLADTLKQYDFVLSSAGNDAIRAVDKAWRITPSWRRGRSPIKLGSFLRGQNIPLHGRNSSPIIVCEGTHRDGTDMEPLLVAVKVDKRWIVDADWIYENVEDPRQNDACIVFQLESCDS